MIVSHSRRFVFVRTRKTAGSSIEAALAPHLGPEDIITGSAQDGTERRNAPDGAKAHDGWRKIRKLCGGQKLAGYWWFSVERNPWDKCVSEWLFKRRIGIEQRFGESLRSKKLPVEWDKYAGKKGLVCEVFRFEEMDEAWPRICSLTGVGDIPLPRLKVSEGRGHYRDYYNRRRAGIVERAFAREISEFGYRY